jgi:hypothetical protein
MVDIGSTEGSDASTGVQMSVVLILHMPTGKYIVGHFENSNHFHVKEIAFLKFSTVGACWDKLTNSLEQKIKLTS